MADVFMAFRLATIKLTQKCEKTFSDLTKNFYCSMQSNHLRTKKLSSFLFPWNVIYLTTPRVLQ